MQSEFTVKVTINHDEDLNVEASTLAYWVAGDIAKDLRLANARESEVKQWGRFARVGSETNGVTTYLQSAFISRKGS